MPYNILTIPEFDKNVKRLSKKYRNIKNDILSLVKELNKNNTLGTHIINNCYKVRLANSSIPVGKSKGFRVITYYVDSNNNIYLLTIYPKSEINNIPDYKIKELLKEVKQ